jgi:hypothetical protein
LLVNGIKIKYEKYKIVKIWPVKIKGSSTGRMPIQDKRITHEQNNQKIVLFIGVILSLFILLYFLVKGSEYKINTDKAKATTPPNLLGIERRIA